MSRRFFCAWFLWPVFAMAESLPPIHLTIKDLTPKFLKFYAEAKDASLAKRWELWKKDYAFAAVPPTSEGDQIARQMLDAAWSKFPSALPQICRGAASIMADPRATAERIAELLRPEKPVEITLLVYVGGFEGNAFTAADKGKIVTALPIEDNPDTRASRMTHELTHAEHIAMGSFSGWVDSHRWHDCAHGRAGDARH